MRYIVIMFLYFVAFWSNNEIANCQSIGNYKKEVILNLANGFEPGKVGLSTSSGYGPSSFTIDRNENIYLLDAVNKRVLVFDMHGDLINYFPLDDKYSYNRCVIVYDGFRKWLFIHHRYNRVFNIYTLKGELIQSFTYEGSMSVDYSVEENRVVSEFGIISISELGGGNDSGVEVQQNTDVQNKYSFGGKYSDIQYIKAPPTLTSGNIFTLEYPDKESDQFDFSSIITRYRIYFLCETPDMNPIFIAYPSIKDQSKLLIKLDHNMKLIAMIEDEDLLPITKYHIERPILKTDSGSIYTLSVNDRGAQVYKWQID